MRRTIKGAAALAITSLSALASAPVASAGWLLPESGGSANADSIAELYLVVLVIAGVIFFAVTGTLVYFLVRYRKRRGAVAAQVHGNTQLEIAWTAGAALILVALAVLTFTKLDGIVTPARSGPATAGALYASIDQPRAPGGKELHVKVTGRQFIWKYEYPNGAYSYEELIVPVDTTIVLDLFSIDVNHSWWIPKLGGKSDAIPGYTNHTWFKTTRTGVFSGQCAELCGVHHAEMVATVRVVSPEAYEAWLVRQKRLIAEAEQLRAQQRQQMLRDGQLMRDVQP
jgi:cytochrome c oxidase subunit 2